jgi:hypothetical protein
MPLDQRGTPLPPDDDRDEDVLASRHLPPRYRDGSPLPPDPPGQEDLMTPAPWRIRQPRQGGGRRQPR